MRFDFLSLFPGKFLYHQLNPKSVFRQKCSKILNISVKILENLFRVGSVSVAIYSDNTLRLNTEYSII